MRNDLAALLERLERQMSHFREDSELTRFNRFESTDWFDVPPELADVVRLSLDVSRDTEGAFDITVAPLVELWGFGPKGRPSVPHEAAIDAIRSHVGWRLLECRDAPPGLRKGDPKLALDLGAVGKGYAVDRIAELLDERGIDDYLISLAGELRGRGSSSTGKPWRVGIETPTPDTRRVVRTLDLHNEALSTSGDYRQFFEHAGTRYSHGIDPRTGRPVSHALASVSVLHRSSARADALATGLMVIGPDIGYATALRLGVDALFILRHPDRFELRGTGRFAPDASDPAMNPTFKAF